jgi:hypothetical protein
LPRIAEADGGHGHEGCGCAETDSRAQRESPWSAYTQRGGEGTYDDRVKLDRRPQKHLDGVLLGHITARR